METLEYPVLPVVRQIVAKLATAARYILIASAGLGLAEPALLLLYQPLVAIVCGMISTLLLHVGLALVVILAIWCHLVLLAGGGAFITRWLLAACAMLAPLSPICWIFTLFSGRLLLYRQGELPLLLCLVLLFSAIMNLPRMAAAPRKLQACVIALPVLLLLAFCTNAPGFIIICLVFKLLAALLARKPLRLLASAAPRIISLPPKDN